MPYWILVGWWCPLHLAMHCGQSFLWPYIQCWADLNRGNDMSTKTEEQKIKEMLQERLRKVKISYDLFNNLVNAIHVMAMDEEQDND